MLPNATHTHATTDSAHSSHDQGDPLKTYLAIFGCLLVLLLLTVGAYYLPFERLNIGDLNLGFMNTAIALTIASIKAGLVLLFFMHLRHSTRLTWVVATAGFLWLGIMVLFIFADYLSRGTIREANREAAVDVQAGTHANGEALLEYIPNQVQTPNW